MSSSREIGPQPRHSAQAQPLQSAPWREEYATPSREHAPQMRLSAQSSTGAAVAILEQQLEPQPDMEQQSQSGMTRRQKQRLRRKMGSPNAVASAEIASMHPDTGFPECPAENGRGSVNADVIATQRTNQSARSRLPDQGLERAGDGNDFPVSIASQVHACSRTLLSRAFTNLKKEFEIQVLIWNSLPRRNAGGRTELGVLRDAGPEANVHAVVQSCLQLASCDTVLAASTALLAVQQPTWDDTVLSSAMARSMQAVLAAKTSSESVARIPSTLLSTGRTAEAAVHDRTASETSEMRALIAACKLQESDALLVSRAFGIVEQRKQQASSRKKDAGKGREGKDNRYAQHPPGKHATLHKVKTRVKNTFLELDDDSDGPDTFFCSGSSVRSMSAPSRSGTSCCTSVYNDSESEHEIGSERGRRRQ